MSKAFEVLKRYLRKEQWSVEQVAGKLALRAQVDTELCPITYYLQIIEERHQFLFYICPDLKLPADILPEVTEYVTRVNSGMRIGNFEVDYTALVVCFKSSINFTGAELSEALIDAAVQPAMEAFQEFFPGMASVIAGLVSPVAAFQEAQGSK